MASQYITRTVNYMSGGVSTSTTMEEAQFGTRGPATGHKWYTCVVCGLDYPEDKVMLKGGAAYCFPLKCYRDLEDEWSK